MKADSIKKMAAAVFLVSLAAAASSATASTPVTWATAGVSGNWSDSTKWNPTVIPNGSYDVSVPGSETVTVDISPTIDSLALPSGNPSLNIGTSQTLTINGAVTTTSGTITEGDGSVVNAGSFSNAGGIVMGIFNTGSVASTLNVTGSFTNTGLFNSSENPNGGNHANFGSISNQGGFFKVYNKTVVTVTNDVTNQTGAVFQMDGGSTIEGNGNSSVTVSGTFNNAGTAWVGSTGDVLKVNALNNTGTLVIGGSVTQPNFQNVALTITGGGLGVTDIPAGSTIIVESFQAAPTFTVVNGATTTDALANLSTVEGVLRLENRQGYQLSSLAVSSSGGVLLANNTHVTIPGTLTNNGFVNVNVAQIGLNSGATLDLGTGSFSASNAFQQLSNGTYNEVIGGSSNFGKTNVSGSAVLDGTLNVSLANGFVPAFNQSFTIFTDTPGQLIGTYANVTGAPYGGGQWLVTYNDAAGTVKLTAVPEPASLGLLALGSLTLLHRVRRKSC